MAQPLIKVKSFFENADEYSTFLARVEAAIVEKAIAIRAEDTPETITLKWRARQQWAVSVLSGAARVNAVASAMLPALTNKANKAGLLNETGVIDATDEQILATITDDFIDYHAGYVPDVPVV